MCVCVVAPINISVFAKSVALFVRSIFSLPQHRREGLEDVSLADQNLAPLMTHLLICKFLLATSGCSASDREAGHHLSYQLSLWLSVTLCSSVGRLSQSLKMTNLPPDVVR